MRIVYISSLFFIGCLVLDASAFGLSNDSRFVHAVKKWFSKEPNEQFNPETAVQFELFTKTNPTIAQIISPLNINTIESSNFNARIPTRLFIHGWKYKGRLGPKFVDAFFSRGHHDVNFIFVNWKKASQHLNYAIPRKRINSIGPYVAQLVNILVRDMHANLSDIHIIGHSLGAHIAGIAGKYITGGKVAKIVGLDPAAPLFNYDLNDTRLHYDDAQYVETVHTNAGRLGFWKPIGHASFYPNGGKSQPGCSWDPMGACSHKRSADFYIESLYSNIEFYGVGCESLKALGNGLCNLVGDGARMGGEPGNLDHVRGIFLLQTNSQSPFARGRPSPFP